MTMCVTTDVLLLTIYTAHEVLMYIKRQRTTDTVVSFSLSLPSKRCSVPESMRRCKNIGGGRSLLRTIAAGRTKRLICAWEQTANGYRNIALNMPYVNIIMSIIISIIIGK